MIINYLPNYYSSSLASQNVLLGYNINGISQYFNQYSNAFGSTANPFLVFNQKGNTSKIFIKAVTYLEIQ